MKGGEETNSFPDMVCMTLKNESGGVCMYMCCCKFFMYAESYRFFKSFFFLILGVKARSHQGDTSKLHPITIMINI